MKNKKSSRLFDVFPVTVLTILLPIVLLRILVRTADRKTTSLLVIAENRVHAQIVVENIKAHLIHVLNILKFYRGYVKIRCFKKMKIFSIYCQSWKTAKSGFGETVDNYNIDVLCLTETSETDREPVTYRKWSKISKP